ncbi:uncharacterized protein [Ptychodera flava]|uniref:uncharacterized protein n=1 Tax=Ptychodera flava TaxID=63121 RepID=UPI00396A59C9
MTDPTTTYISSAETILPLNVDLQVAAAGQAGEAPDEIEQIRLKTYVVRKCRRYISYTNGRLNYPGEVEVRVWDTVFQVHAAILRESGSYFRELLTEHWCGIPNTTNAQHFIAINDTAITPLTLKVILDYLYFGKLYVTLDKIEEVYVATEFLDIDVDDRDMITDFSLSGISMDLTGEERDIHSDIYDLADSDSGKLSFDREGASSLGDDSDLAILTTSTKETDFDSGADSAISVETPRLGDFRKMYRDSVDSMSLCSEATEYGLRDSFETYEEIVSAGTDDMTLKEGNASDGDSSVDTILSDQGTPSNRLSSEKPAGVSKTTQSIAVQTDVLDFEDRMSLGSWRSGLHGSLSSLSLLDHSDRAIDQNSNEAILHGEYITEGELFRLRTGQSYSSMLSSEYPGSASTDIILEDDDEYESYTDEESVVEPGELSSPLFAGKEDDFVRLVRFMKTGFRVARSGRSSPSKTPSRCSSRCSGSFRWSRFETFQSEEWEDESLHEDEGLIRRGFMGGSQDDSKWRRPSARRRADILEDFAEFMADYDMAFDEGATSEDAADQEALQCLLVSAVLVQEGRQSLCCYDGREENWKEFDSGVGIWRVPGRRWFSNSRRVYCLQYQERSPVFQRRLMYYDCKTGKWERTIPSLITTCSLSVLGLIVDDDDVIYVIEGGVIDSALTLHLYDPNIQPPSWDVKIVPTLQLEKISQENRLGIETDLVQFLDVCHSQGCFYFLYLKYKDPTVYLGRLQPPDEFDKEWSAKEVMRVSEHFYNEIWRLVGDAENMYAVLVNHRRILIMKILPETCVIIHIGSLDEGDGLFPLVRLEESKRWSTSAVMVNRHIDICNFPSSSHVCRFDLVEREWSSVPLPVQDANGSRTECVTLVNLDLQVLPEVLARTERIGQS